MKRNISMLFFVIIIVAGLIFLSTGCTNPKDKEKGFLPKAYMPLAEQHVVEVASVTELINAIKPSAHITVKPGNYNLSQYLEKMNSKELEDWNNTHDYVKIEDVTDGVEIIIKDTDALTIVGGGEAFEDTEFVTEPRYAAVFNFDNCSELKLCNFRAGHTDAGYCTGNVINLLNCNEVDMGCLDLYGCGVYGIGAYHTRKVKVNNSIIRDCTYGPLEIFNCSEEMKFTKCTFTGSKGFSNTDDLNNMELNFIECIFGSWETADFKARDNINTTDCTWHKY